MQLDILTDNSIALALPFLQANFNGLCPNPTLLQEYRLPHVAVIAAYDRLRPIGLAVAGNLTARGLIADISVTDPAVADSLLAETLKYLAQSGTRRVHAIVACEEKWKIALLKSNGFVVNQGEVAMLKLLTENEQFTCDQCVSRMSAADIAQAHKLLSSRAELALCPWEDVEFFAKNIDSPNAALFVTKDKGEVTGVLVGGSFLGYGAICHVVVANHYRGRSLGKYLCQRALFEFAARGVKRVHLIVTANNHQVLSFWDEQGFVLAAPKCLALEIDC